MSLGDALGAQEDRLLGCVHCGFCLPACPTYVRLGDEADSPRGRLYLMRAVVEGRLEPAAPAFQEHIDRCLGCRACETVCPSGVEYGLLLERARQVATRARRPATATRVALKLFGSRRLLPPAMTLARMLRGTGLPALVARFWPGRRSALRLAAGMLAATRPWRPRRVPGPAGEAPGPGPATARPEAIGWPEDGGVALLDGCVQEGLFSHVNRATRRVLAANGCRVVKVPGQGCCGALHAHAGDLDTARDLARSNIEAFEASGAGRVVVNAAGCGAAMKEYGHLLDGDPAWRDRARAFAERVLDVSEALEMAGPRQGAALALRVAYDAPCHLLHGQGVEHAPLRVLASIPELEVAPLARASECCGGAGIYGVTHPDLGGRIGDDKVTDVDRALADVVATPNPGCIMQIGAGVRARGPGVDVVHPVEILDESYRRGGLYRDG